MRGPDGRVLHPAASDRAERVRRGWPGPMARWSHRMHLVFDRVYQEELLRGTRDPLAWARAYGAVTTHRDGRRR